MTTSEKIETYIEKKGDGWKKPILLQLRSILLQCDLNETVKWGAPTYENGGNVVAFASFKHHVSLWFYQGVFLKDEHKVLLAADSSTKGLRQWRFCKGDVLNEDLVRLYVVEAVENMKAGKKLKPQRKTESALPEALEKALQSNSRALEHFQKMTLSQRNEYAEYIADAKRPTTVDARLEKCIEYISKGLDLNHKYRK